MQRTPLDGQAEPGMPETWNLYSRKLKVMTATIQHVMAPLNVKIPSHLKTAITLTLGRLSACAPKLATLPLLHQDQAIILSEQTDLSFALIQLDKLEHHLQSLQPFSGPSTPTSFDGTFNTLKQEIESLRTICRVRARQIANGMPLLTADITLH